MRIAYASPHDFKGGASRIAWYLFDGMRREGHETAFFAGKKSLDDEAVQQVRRHAHAGQALWAGVRRRVDREMGLEHFHYPETTRQILAWRPDLVHFHNPQGGYFDLRTLPELTRRVPVLFTLHDPWMFTGHCAYFIECERWRTGCGQCPDLARRPSLKRDGTAFNWVRKRRLYRASRFHVATPSRWLLDQAGDSILAEGMREGRVIHNGVDHEVFRPADASALRRRLGIGERETVLLYVVNSGMRTNPYKDYHTVSAAVERLRELRRPDEAFTFVAVGADGPDEAGEGVRRIHVGHVSDPAEMASYFNLADLYVHAARAENYPNVVMEALACGTPCIVTRTGGVPEQIVEGETGWVVPFEGAWEMADRVLAASRDREALAGAGAAARAWVERSHTLGHMLAEYEAYYTNILQTEGVAIDG